MSDDDHAKRHRLKPKIAKIKDPAVAMIREINGILLESEDNTIDGKTRGAGTKSEPTQSLMKKLHSYATAMMGGASGTARENWSAIVNRLESIEEILKELAEVAKNKQRQDLPDPFEAGSDEETTTLSGLLADLKKHFTKAGHDVDVNKDQSTATSVIRDFMDRADKVDVLSQQTFQAVKEGTSKRK